MIQPQRKIKFQMEVMSTKNNSCPDKGGFI